MRFQILKKIAILFFLMLLPVALAEAGKAETKDILPGIIAGLQTKYNSISTLSAEFVQEAYSSTLESSEHARGTVSFKKPGMMRWDYFGGGEIVSNGKLIWVFDPDLAQTIETSVDPSRPGISTDFLSGLGNLERDFEIKLLRVDATGYELSLTPKTPMGNTTKLLVEIDKDFLLKKTTAIDSFNNETRVEFHGIKINIEIPNDRFVYKKQKGIKIIRP